MMERTLKEWIVAARPWALPASLMPVLVSMAYVFNTKDASLEVNWLFGLLAMLGVALIHTAGNLISDYHDYVKGVDHAESFNVQTLVSGRFTTREVLTYGLISLTLGTIIGLFLLFQVGMPILYIGLFGVLCALFYYFFKFRALGDLMIFLAFGPMSMLGTGMVLTNQIDTKLLLLSIPIGFITVGILHANNTRDIVSDTKAGIKTFASVLGLGRSIAYYQSLIYGAYSFIFALGLIGFVPILVPIVSLLSLFIMGNRNIVTMRMAAKEISSINMLDGMTAQLQLAFSVLVSVALVIDKFIR